jgi:uncharacterized membrane protein
MGDESVSRSEDLEALVKTTAGAIFDQVPAKERPKVLRIVERVSLAISHHSGPIPSSQELQKYDQVLPGAAERIVTRSEMQSDHRMALEKSVVNAQIAQSDRGQWIAAGLSAFCIIASVIVTLSGYPWVGGTLGGTTVVSLAGAFIYGKWEQRRDLEAKKKDNP